MHSPECPGWFSFLSLNAVDEKGAHFARNSTCMSQEPQHSSASSQRLKGWRRRTSSPERGFLRLGLGSAEGLPWHVPHSRPSSQQLPWTPLSCRCWLPSSAVLPASWLVLCWRCCCWPLERWMGSSETLVSVQGLTLPGRSVKNESSNCPQTTEQSPETYPLPLEHLGPSWWGLIKKGTSVHSMRVSTLSRPLHSQSRAMEEDRIKTEVSQPCSPKELDPAYVANSGTGGA